jgi:hypothetical protein
MVLAAMQPVIKEIQYHQIHQQPDGRLIGDAGPKRVQVKGLPSRHTQGSKESHRTTELRQKQKPPQQPQTMHHGGVSVIVALSVTASTGRQRCNGPTTATQHGDLDQPDQQPAWWGSKTTPNRLAKPNQNISG